MATTWNLKSSMLKFALADARNDIFCNFCEPLMIKRLGLQPNGLLLLAALRDYQNSSEPISLGRHLLTDISINALHLSRTTEYDSMAFEQKRYKSIIDSLKKAFPIEYLNALDELRYIVEETQKMIRDSGKEQVTLYRKLCVKEGGVVAGQLGNDKIFMDTNILTSYTPFNKLEGYTGTYWSEVSIVRDIPVDQVIIHPSYIHIADFEFAEQEAIIYNPSQRVIMQLPDRAF